MKKSLFGIAIIGLAALVLGAQYGGMDVLGILKVNTIQKLDAGTAVYVEDVYISGGVIGAPTDRPTVYGVTPSAAPAADYQLANKKYVDDKALTTDTTVNLTSGMTAAQIQALIDAQPKNLGGKTLTFQFGDGTYNTSMTSALVFQYFYNGALNIYGNTSETDATALHTTQSVYLDFSAGTSNGIEVNDCYCYVYVRNLKIWISDTASIHGIYMQRSPATMIRYNYVLATGKTAANTAIRVAYGRCYCMANYVSNTQEGIKSSVGAVIHSNGNDDTGTAPNYGLTAIQGATVSKEGTQPSGTTANENTAIGGEIR